MTDEDTVVIETTEAPVEEPVVETTAE